MSKTENRDAFVSIAARKKFGLPSEFGLAQFGFSRYGKQSVNINWQPFGLAVYGTFEFGENSLLSGVWQMRTIKMGEPTVGTKYHYKKRPIRMKFYGSSGVETEGQAAQRAKLAAAVAAYQALTPAERLVYHTNAVGLHMSGYNLFLKEQMTS